LATLGRKLRRARERSGLTQAALAEVLRVSAPYISATEAGREACSPERAAAWLDACKRKR
jgi:transcriptional regulator with XRE-family HTH domain